MADISDVQQYLVNTLTTALYPNGTSQPSAITNPVKVYAGWPLPAQLDADLVAAMPIVHLSVYVQPGMEQVTSRYPRDWYTQTTVPCSLTATILNNTITVGGTVTAGHYLTIHLGNTPASYAALANDTTATVAAALGALLNSALDGLGQGFTLGQSQIGAPVSVSGSVITVPAVFGGRIVVRGAAPGTVVRELERTKQAFLVTAWAPNNALRVAAAKIFRPTLAAISMFPLPDGFAGWLTYEGSRDTDRSEKQNIYCRDVTYWVEYPTTQSMVAYPITTTSTSIEVDPITNLPYTPLPWSSFTPTDTVNS